MSWFREPRWRNRLVAERLLLEERFPGFVPTLSPNDELVWRGVLEPIEGRAFVLSVTMPRRYPYQEPQLRIEQPRLRPGSPHLYQNGTLCVHQRKWDPTRGTVASTIPLAAAWLIGYLRWLESGERF